jgi:hypothetical protein
MITETDALGTLEFDDYFVILPSLDLWDVAEFASAFSGRACPEGFKYNSGTNSDFLSVEQIRQLIGTHVGPASQH